MDSHVMIIDRTIYGLYLTLNMLCANSKVIVLSHDLYVAVDSTWLVRRSWRVFASSVKKMMSSIMHHYE